ncbi:GerA spore germination protein [Fictibacillus solisalsi]|uniref:GerA spore germination protein n=1 Tax=Fictibacillus solisalsi TaxID=459525 RepID=A0A1G9TTF9_9BACL|nr:spore germination protein [Fictibacillus solisalsi]SDM51009.1 GerA spore germination protein [Fictibacillus solisalsi]
MGFFKKPSHLPTSSENKTGSTISEAINEEVLRTLLGKCEDIQFVPFFFNQQKVVLIYCEGLISNEMLYKVVPDRLEAFFNEVKGDPTEEDFAKRLHLPSVTTIKSKDQAVSEIFAGKLFIDAGLENTVLSIDISDKPQRNPEETKNELTVLGPRDNFIEDLTVNMALIRKRLRTPTLLTKSFEIGRRTRTKISLLYMEDISNKDILAQIMDKITTIDIDGIFSGTQLEELFNKSPYALFPRHAYTGRPDFAVQSLLNGRFIILIDGTSYAFITPINLFYLLKGSEDKETTYIYSSFERMIRIIGLSSAAFLPGFWVALTAFHQNQLPLTLLATVVESRRGVPLPTTLEAIFMLLLFELFREAGMRLPTGVGQTLSVIGGLIIGDAAIRAGLTSPAMLVVIAGSTIATFTLANQALIGTVSLIRFFVIICVSFLGFFGFFISIFFVLTYIGNIRTFGLPYFGLVTRIDLTNMLKSAFRLPETKKDKRPNMLNPQDSTRKEGGSS